MCRRTHALNHPSLTHVRLSLQDMNNAAEPAAEDGDSPMPTTAQSTGRHHTAVRKDSSFYLNASHSSTGTMETIGEENQVEEQQ